jgi:hypothetical protein
VPVDSEAA